MKGKGLVQIWVAPEFKRKLKTESSMNDMTVATYSSYLAKMPTISNPNMPRLEDRERKRFRFDF